MLFLLRQQRRVYRATGQQKRVIPGGGGGGGRCWEATSLAAETDSWAPRPQTTVKRLRGTRGQAARPLLRLPAPKGELGPVKPSQALDALTCRQPSRASGAAGSEPQPGSAREVQAASLYSGPVLLLLSNTTSPTRKGDYTTPASPRTSPGGWRQETSRQKSPGVEPEDPERVLGTSTPITGQGVQAQKRPSRSLPTIAPPKQAPTKAPRSPKTENSPNRIKSAISKIGQDNPEFQKTILKTVIIP